MIPNVFNQQCVVPPKTQKEFIDDILTQKEFRDDILTKRC